MSYKFHQGKYVPRNSEKYIGNTKNVVFRSSWERKMFLWCDNSPSVVKWASEEIIIPYKYSIDGKVHRYFVDLWIEYKKKDGTTQRWLIEIKPYAQTIPPKIPKKINEAYKARILEYEKNRCKWEAAKVFCERRNWKFVILTEKIIFKGAK